jgi:hypothetical protein
MTNACIVLTLFFSQLAFASFDNELNSIALVETKGGIFLNHRVIEGGMHKGTRAGGWYGLMPITARDLVLRSKDLRKKYGNILPLSNSAITKLLNHNRKMDREIAMYYWSTLRKKFGPKRAAYSWLFGPNKVNKVSETEIVNHNYVKRFDKHLKAMRNVAAKNSKH